MGMIGMGNECYLYVNGISVSKPIWLHDLQCAIRAGRPGSAGGSYGEMGREISPGHEALVRRLGRSQPDLQILQRCADGNLYHQRH